MATAILAVAAVTLIALGVAFLLVRRAPDHFLGTVVAVVFFAGLYVEDALLIAYLILGVGA